MLIQNKIIDAAKNIISSSFAANNVTNWNVYGQFDGLDNKGLKFPLVRIQCYDEIPYYAENKIGWHDAALEIITSAIRITGSLGQGTTSQEFETVSDYAINPFLLDGIEGAMTGATNNLTVKLVAEAGLTTTPLTDGWIAIQKLKVVCARTA